MNTYGTVHLRYLAHFFLEWEMFQTNVLEKIKKKIVPCNLFSKIVQFMRCGKIVQSRAGHR